MRCIHPARAHIGKTDLSHDCLRCALCTSRLRSRLLRLLALNRLVPLAHFWQQWCRQRRMLYFCPCFSSFPFLCVRTPPIAIENCNKRLFPFASPTFVWHVFRYYWWLYCCWPFFSCGWYCCWYIHDGTHTYVTIKACHCKKKLFKWNLLLRIVCCHWIFYMKRTKKKTIWEQNISSI